MNKPFAYLALGTLLTVGALTYARPAHACSCMRPPDPATALDGSTAVFEGTVIGMEKVEGDALPGVVKYTFEVTRRWKGDTQPGQTVELVTADNSAACGRNFEDGQAYLVYASTIDDGLGDNLCSRTMASAQATEQGDFAALGPDLDSPAEPAPPAEPEEPRVDPPAGGDDGGGGPPPTEAGKQGCAVTSGARESAPLAMLCLGLFGFGLTVRTRLR